LPSLDGLYRELAADGLTLLLVNLAEDRETVLRTVRDRGYAAPTLLDATGEVARAYRVRATPTTFVVGKDGTLRARAIGPRPWSGPDGRALLRTLLGEPGR
jgi:hypothetical protein